jgi:3-methyladenine DNA glycosylase/8-oxoguanine DNA glycosylase
MPRQRLAFLTRLNLDALPPYNFSLTVHKPAGWSLLTPHEIFKTNVLWTGMRLNSGEMFGLKLRCTGSLDRPRISCTIFSHTKTDTYERSELAEKISWMLGTKENIREFYGLAEHDPLVQALVHDLYGMRRTRRPDIFPSLILAITLQMAPITRSDQMMNLLIQEYGEKIVFDNKEIPYWPSPKTIAKTSVKELEKKCKLGYRAKALKTTAETIQKGFPNLQELENMSPEEAKAKLMQLKGIGDYSADIVTPHPGFALDVWSAKIFSLLLFRKEPQNPRDIIPKIKKIAQDKWGKWRGYVFTYVLNDLDNLSKRFNLNLTEI